MENKKKPVITRINFSIKLIFSLINFLLEKIRIKAENNEIIKHPM